MKDESVDKKFFASLDVLKYHRFAEKIESGDSKRKNVLQAEVFRSLWDEANRFRAPRTRFAEIVNVQTLQRLARIRNIILSLYNAAECATVMRHNLSANLTKLFKKEAKSNPDDLIDDKTDNKSVLSLNSDIRENHLNSLMDKLLRGEETEGGFILNG